MKLYLLDSIQPFRRELFPLLKPFFKHDEFTDRERVELYGISEKDVTFVTTPEEAHWAVLPMSWNLYVKQKQLKSVIEWVQSCLLYTSDAADD